MFEERCIQLINTWNRDIKMQAVLEVFMEKSSGMKESNYSLVLQRNRTNRI